MPLCAFASFIDEMCVSFLPERGKVNALDCSFAAVVGSLAILSNRPVNAPHSNHVAVHDNLVLMKPITPRGK
jgi:hypothetical protein